MHLKSLRCSYKSWIHLQIDPKCFLYSVFVQLLIQINMNMCVILGDKENNKMANCEKFEIWVEHKWQLQCFISCLRVEETDHVPVWFFFFLSFHLAALMLSNFRVAFKVIGSISSAEQSIFAWLATAWYSVPGKKVMYISFSFGRSANTDLVVTSNEKFTFPIIKNSKCIRLSHAIIK